MRVVMLTVLLIGCKKVEPAPTALDDLAHYYWTDFDTDAVEFGAATANLDAAIGGSTIDDMVFGAISDLTAEELELVGMGDRDPAAPAGIYYANVVRCSLAELEEHSYAINQDELHAGTYEGYQREYTTDFDAYTSRQVDTLEWVSVYDVAGLGVEYTATINGTMRFLPSIDDEATPHGDLLLVRGVLDEPGYIEGSDNERGLMQDYQLEVFYARAPREVIHFYVMWRDMIYTSSVNFDSESAQSLVIGGLEDWDKEAEEWCGAR